jgi:hypothetical protein
MPTRYQVLRRVVLRHEYFTDQRLPGLVARPLAATAERLHRAGLLFKPQPDGFVVLSGSPYPVSAPLPAPHPAAAAAGLPPPQPDGLFPLLFGIYPQDPEFFAYSDVALRPAAGCVFCLHPQPGLPPAGPPPPDGQLPATYQPAPDGLTAGTLEQVALRPLQFWHPVALGVPITLVTPTGQQLRLVPVGPALQIVPVGQAPPPSQPTQAPSLLLDLRSLGSGFYQLQDGPAAALRFYADDLAGPRPWSLLALEAPGPPTLQAATDYTLGFAARATYWQYTLWASHQPAAVLAQAIVAGPEAGPTPQFALVPPAELPAGAVAGWRATAPQPLRQRYHTLPYRLVLPPPGKGPPQVLCPALPQAGATGFKPTSSDNISKSGNNSNYILRITDIFVHL